ncbi:MAG TPA: tetratricopeptide repeat protein [Terracidiphilus sp.]|nr:tetratricopeptide repeat protein [Terracidiphilus sp.]
MTRLNRMMRILTALACIALATPLTARSDPEKPQAEIERDFKAAMAAQDAGNLDQAELLLLRLHEKHPGIFAVDESLALVYVAKGNYAASVPIFEAAVREQPGSDVAHANLGAAYFKLNRNEPALRELRIAAKLNPGNPATQQSLGQVLLAAHQPDLAAAAFERALKMKPGDSDLLLARATAMLAAGKTAAARDVITQWPGTDKSAAAQSLLGDIDEKSGSYREAADHYVRAVDLEPSEENAWKLGIEFLRHWTFDAAIKEFNAAAKQFPESTRLKLGLGAAYFGDGKYAESVPVFAGLLQADSDNPLYAELLGMSCTSVMQEARPRCSALRKYAETHPRDARASVDAAAEILQEPPNAEELKLAGRFLKNAIAADPKDPEALYQLGLLKQNQGNWVGSIANLEAAIALKPTLAAAHYRLGLAYWRAGRKVEARREIALQRKYYKQQQDDLDARMRQITTFLVKVHK